MPYDPFVILGVQKGATQSEILEAYKEKRGQYQSLVFEEGEVGADAARKIQELDNAYQLAMEYTHDSASVSGGEEAEGFDAFSDVKDAIKNKDFSRAQSLLDDNFDRNGEWHYYQAIIYYEKSWLQESKKQLEIALTLDPANAKYQKALDNMKKKIDGTNAFNDSKEGKSKGKRTKTNQNEEYHYQRSYQQQSSEDTACRVCQGLLCADCCCECMGGDLISCC